MWLISDDIVVLHYFHSVCPPSAATILSNQLLNEHAEHTLYESSAHSLSCVLNAPLQWSGERAY